MGFKVMVVDDDTDILKLYRIFLTRAGFSVTTAENGLEAINQIRQSPPQLVISDIRMPVMDGFGLLKQIDDLTYPLPVIFISGYSGSEASYNSPNLKAFYSKPLRNQELCNIVKKFELDFLNSNSGGDL